MDDTTTRFPEAAPITSKVHLQVDPKLLARALKKMQALVRGNGFDPDKVILLADREKTTIEMYRFPAQISLRLSTLYGTKTEAGKNTIAEIMPSETEFKRQVEKIVTDACTDPIKREQIEKFILDRPDKGFGIEQQKTKFAFLQRTFVQHEKCISCKNLGRTPCPKCHGNGRSVCVTCHGRKIVPCLKCRGSGKTHTSNGNTIPCQFCRADGKIACPKCRGGGQQKCRLCAATGQISCRPCAATGWISHLSNIDVYADIQFDFDRTNLPPNLINAIQSNPSRCVLKHDIEVSLTKAKSLTVEPVKSVGEDTLQPVKVQNIMTIDYEVIAPFGPLTFQTDHQELSGFLFGFQSRFLGFPHFLEGEIEKGLTLLSNAAAQKMNRRQNLELAASTQTILEAINLFLTLKSAQKAAPLVYSKYAPGIGQDMARKIVFQVQSTLKKIYTPWQWAGTISGWVAMALLSVVYYLGGGRLAIWATGTPEAFIALIDLSLLLGGIGLSVLSGCFLARIGQNKTLRGIINDEILSKSLPKAGRTIHWSILAGALVTIGILGVAIYLQSPIPLWLQDILSAMPFSAGHSN